MGHKEQLGLLLFRIKEALEIKGGDHGLASAGGGDDQVAPAVMSCPFPLQRLQDALLKRVGTKIEEYCRSFAAIFAMGYGRPQDFRLLRIKGYELPVVPVGIKLGSELFDDMAHVLGSHFQIPFEAAGHGSLGHIG